jgi:hypothetical protein
LSFEINFLCLECLNIVLCICGGSSKLLHPLLQLGDLVVLLARNGDVLLKVIFLQPNNVSAFAKLPL